MSNPNNIYLIIFIIMIFAISIFYNIQHFNKNNIEPLDFFTCTLNLDNINPYFADNYMKFNDQHVSCGVCTNSTLKVNVTKCPLDENGSPLSSCKQKATLSSSLGNPVTFDRIITPESVSNFFCIT